jgi:hypothetical protein
MRIRLLSIFCIALIWNGFSRVATAQTPSQALSFPIGQMEGAAPAAQVTVEKVVPIRKKRSLLHPRASVAQVAFGIAVRFEQPRAAALAEIPETLRSLIKFSAKSKIFLIRRLAIFAPGDPVPRLMADEAHVSPKGEWIFKRALFFDRRGAADCRLVWDKAGEAKFTFPKGSPLEFSNLLADKPL